MSNPIGWIEVPVADMQRAVNFYNEVFDWELKVTRMGKLDMAWFPWEEGATGASGSLCWHPDFYHPSISQGPLIYFSCQDVGETLKKVSQAGGKILNEKKLITKEVGYMGVFLDSEGNRIALHSQR